jgi:hypothetical protein
MSITYAIRPSARVRTRSGVWTRWMLNFHQASSLTVMFPRLQKYSGIYAKNEKKRLIQNQRYSPKIWSSLNRAPIQHQYWIEPKICDQGCDDHMQAETHCGRFITLAPFGSYTDRDIEDNVRPYPEHDPLGYVEVVCPPSPPDSYEGMKCDHL